MRRLIMRAYPLTNFLKASIVRSTAADVWVATRFMGTAGGEQKSEVRSQRSDDRGQETVLKNVEALQSYNREGELPGPQGERTPRWEIKPAHNDQSRGVVIFPGIHRS